MATVTEPLLYAVVAEFMTAERNACAIDMVGITDSAAVDLKAVNTEKRTQFGRWCGREQISSIWINTSGEQIGREGAYRHESLQFCGEMQRPR